MRTEVKPPVQDLSKGIREITADPRLAVPRELQDFRFAVGATAAIPKDTTRWSGEGQALPDGRKCWRVTRINTVITVSTTVFIAKEIPKGSCLWHEIAKHEAKHVRLDQKLFPQLAGTIRPALLRAASQSVVAGSEAEAKATLGRRLVAAMQAAADRFEATRNQQQLTIDTREEYSRPNQVCGEAEVAAAIRRSGMMN